MAEQRGIGHIPFGLTLRFRPEDLRAFLVSTPSSRNWTDAAIRPATCAMWELAV